MKRKIKSLVIVVLVILVIFILSIGLLSNMNGAVLPENTFKFTLKNRVTNEETPNDIPFSMDTTDQNNHHSSIDTIYTDTIEEEEGIDYPTPQVHTHSEKTNKVELEAEKAIRDNLIELLSTPINATDFSTLRRRMELHTAMWNLVLATAGEEDPLPLESYKFWLGNSTDFLSGKINALALSQDQMLLATVHQSLYPWLYHHRYSSLADIVRTSHGRGIVMCTGDKHFKYAQSTIDTLRHVLHTTLPIQIFYYGEEDLSPEHRKALLHQDPEITVEDISTYFDQEIVDLQGWAIKPFAILASRFEEVILMDADVVYLHDPEELYEDPGYQDTGTLFFQDRTITPHVLQGVEWLKSWMGDPLPETQALRFYKGETAHEMESSTLVLHKTRNLLGLLAVCKLNEKAFREVIYQYVYGDKETFWIGFDIARQPYYLNPVPCAYIGQVRKEPLGPRLCGHIGHALSNGHFMFWNGHLVKDKNAPKLTEEDLVQLDGYVLDDQHRRWTGDLSCVLLPEKEEEEEEEREVTLLSPEERQTLDTILDRERKQHFILSD